MCAKNYTYEEIDCAIWTYKDSLEETSNKMRDQLDTAGLAL